MTGEFGAEGSRKRGREETKEGAVPSAADGDKADFWQGFEDLAKSQGCKFDAAL